MGAFINRATSEYRKWQDEAVRAELKAAGIPVLTLPCYINTEVKSTHIGLLNGFVFWRAWRYWVCSGDMPLDHAKEIYHKYSILMVRAEGHAGNIEPEGYDPILQNEREQLVRTMLDRNASVADVVSAADHIKGAPDNPRFVKQYHIDTSEGLCALVRYIKEHNIYACNGEEGSHQQSIFQNRSDKV